MKNRNKGFAYYGIRSDDEKAIKKSCRNATPEQCELLMEAAMVANAEIADDLYYSLRKGISYEVINNFGCIPIPKVDFYAYRRKCMKIFRDLMILHGNSLLTECGKEKK